MKLTKHITSTCNVSRGTFEVRFTPQGTRVATWRDGDRSDIRYECWNPTLIDELYDLTNLHGEPIRINVTGNIKVFERKTYYKEVITITTFVVESYRIA